MPEPVSFLPRDHYPVEHDRDTLIITTNHLGADIRGDAGLDAQYLADISGHPVVGLNRLGSGNDAKYDRHLAETIIDDPESVTSRWLETISPELRRHAPSKIELVGRSAGANLMLHVASLELIPETVGVMAIEALRFQAVNTRVGQLKYFHYQLCREGKYKNRIDDIVDSDLLPSSDSRPADAANPCLMLGRQLVDIRHYQHRWASDFPFQNALHIAGTVGITAAVMLAAVSMAAEPPVNYERLKELSAARQTSGFKQSFLADVVPLTTHGSFDDSRLYATQYRKFAALVRADAC